MTITDKERRFEEERLHGIVEQLQKRMQGLEGELLDRKESVKQLRRNFWSDISVNDDNWDDLLESYIDISQKSLTLADQERNFLHAQKIYERLRRMSDSPYFGRVDFREDRDEQAEPIYIGISSMLDERDEHFLIYDWRAPISSIYYDHPLGSAEYETPMGIIRGELTEKRQYVIRDGKMIYLFDTGERIGDELLQQILGGNADTQMKSIVATIQREQNQIIRESNKKMVVVQGVAGSGKTSVAMQRIAFLLYQYRHMITSQNMLLLSPNPLFKQYISSVLPELGESNIEQSTLHEYIEARLGRRFELEHPYTHLEQRLLMEADEIHDLYEERLRFKGSLAFYQIIERYIKYLEIEGFCFRSLRFRGKVLISAKEMREQFYSYDPSIRLSNRMEPFVAWLLKRLRDIEKEESKKDWVLEEVELLDREVYQQAFYKVQKRNRKNDESFDDSMLEEMELRKQVVRQHFRPLRQWIKQLYFIDLIAIYKQLFLNHNLLTKLAEGSTLPSDLVMICQQSVQAMRGKFIPYEDSAPLLLLKELIGGFRSYLHILYLLVDEAQDYSPFQFKLLTRLFPRAKWTILGDPNQAIWSNGIDLSYDVPELAQLDADAVMVYYLKRSYRSTKEIVQFTKAILPHAREILAFERSGESPQVIAAATASELLDSILAEIQTLSKNGMKTIAIITKTEVEAIQAYEALHPFQSMQIITKNVQQYETGVLVIPSYLAKGLEFDAVIIYDGSATRYGRENERYLLYTAVTRAMHHLTIFTLGQPSPLLPIPILPS